MNNVLNEGKEDFYRPISWIVIPCYNEERCASNYSTYVFRTDSDNDFKGENQCEKQDFICE